MNEKSRCQVGELACLKSGGPLMTICDLGDDKHKDVQCVWFEDGEHKSKWLNIDNLNILAIKTLAGPTGQDSHRARNGTDRWLAEPSA
jgi:uncharacterized protein YodC (DUF2158 family)